MQLVPAKLPNETLNFILCDVLSTYIHAFVMLPIGYPCWHAHYTLRQVSRHFKSLVDYIWGSAVGNGQCELPKLRIAMSTGNRYKMPECEIPLLIVAYIVYVQTFYDELRLEEKLNVYCVDSTEIADNLQDFKEDLDIMDEFMHAAQPRDMNKILSNASAWTENRRETVSMLWSIDIVSEQAIRKASDTNIESRILLYSCHVWSCF